MEALKEFDIEELLKRQAMLDKKFDEKKTLRGRSQIRTYIAYFTELGELAQELKSEWNYWKNHTKPVDRRKALEELSDCLHFYLSYINAKDEETKGRVIPFLDEFSVEHSKKNLLLTENLIFGAMLSIAKHVGATEEEFLQVHHEKWLENMNERTKGEY